MEEPKDISRRDLLRGGAATIVAGVAGLSEAEAGVEGEARWSKNELEAEKSMYEGFETTFNKKFKNCLRNTNFIKLNIRFPRASKQSPILVDVKDDTEQVIASLIVKAEWRANMLNLGGLGSKAGPAANEIIVQLIEMLDADNKIDRNLARQELMKKSE